MTPVFVVKPRQGYGQGKRGYAVGPQVQSAQISAIPNRRVAAWHRTMSARFGEVQQAVAVLRGVAMEGRNLSRYGRLRQAPFPKVFQTGMQNLDQHKIYNSRMIFKISLPETGATSAAWLTLTI
jgi:hypothetical protein